MKIEDKKRFEEDGYVILRGFFDEETVAAGIRAADELVTRKLCSLQAAGRVDSLQAAGRVDSLQAAGRVDSLLQDHSFETRLIKLREVDKDLVPLLFRAELHQEAFFNYFGCRQLLEEVAALMPEADAIRIFPNYSCRPKLPNFDPHIVVWHQDAGLAADGRPNTAPLEDRLEAFGPGHMVNVWTPLVEANPTTGCMKAIPGSHRLGIQTHQTTLRYREGEEEHDYGTYAAEVTPSVVAQYEHLAVDLSCSPGDVILFSNILIHRGGFNTSDIVRWSLDWRYQDAGKPTHRQENGHVMWSRTNQHRVVKTPEQWAKLALT